MSPSSSRSAERSETREEIRLTAVSYIVLGMVAEAGEATPYELKRRAAAGVKHLWALQHAQLYSEPDRLTQAGYLTRTQERGGRRRKRYQLTARGREALDDWLAEPTRDVYELRDPGLLQLFLGADPVPLAEAQIEVHEAKLEEFKAILEGPHPAGVKRTFEAGVGHELEWIRFWSELARDAGGGGGGSRDGSTPRSRRRR